MMDDLQRTAPHDRIAAQEVRTQPFATGASIRKELLANYLVNGRIVIDEQTNQCGSLALGQSGARSIGNQSLHILETAREWQKFELNSRCFGQNYGSVSWKSVKEWTELRTPHLSVVVIFGRGGFAIPSPR